LNVSVAKTASGGDGANECVQRRDVDVLGGFDKHRPSVPVGLVDSEPENRNSECVERFPKFSYFCLRPFIGAVAVISEDNRNFELPPGRGTAVRFGQVFANVVCHRCGFHIPVDIRHRT
jgi:hypothetical protein